MKTHFQYWIFISNLNFLPKRRICQSNIFVKETISNCPLPDRQAMSNKDTVGILVSISMISFLAQKSYHWNTRSGLDEHLLSNLATVLAQLLMPVSSFMISYWRFSRRQWNLLDFGNPKNIKEKQTFFFNGVTKRNNHLRTADSYQTLYLFLCLI